MTLGYSTKIKGKPTHFVEKIWQGLASELCDQETDTWLQTDGILDRELGNNFLMEHPYCFDPKIHTIREDKKDRWKVGNKIHFVINNRTKNRFQFAPVIPVQTIQKIEIFHSKSNPGTAKIIIDHKLVYDGPKRSCYKRGIEEFVRNDGFDSVEDFFDWFNSDFEGKIIHWTNFKY